MTIEELLSDKSRWTTRCCARDTNDNFVDMDAPTACKWCLIGAVYKCYSGTDGMRVLSDVQKEISVAGFKSIGRFNDDLGYNAVMTVVRKLKI